MSIRKEVKQTRKNVVFRQNLTYFDNSVRRERVERTAMLEMKEIGVVLRIDGWPK